MVNEFIISSGMTRKQVLKVARQAGLSKDERKAIKIFMKSDSDGKMSNNVEVMAVKALFNKNVPYSTQNPGVIPYSDGEFNYSNTDGSFVNAKGIGKPSSILHRNEDGSYSQLRDSDGDGKFDAYVEVDDHHNETRHFDYNN